jgi:hypothetical protein
MVNPIRTFTVTPSLPPELERQRGLVYNLRWAWNHDAIELFRWDRDLWEQSGHNPALMLGTIDQGALQAAASDEGFLARLNRVSNDFDAYQMTYAGRSGEQLFSNRQHYSFSATRQPRPLQIVNDRFSAFRAVIGDQYLHSASIFHHLFLHSDEHPALRLGNRRAADSHCHLPRKVERDRLWCVFSRRLPPRIEEPCAELG